MFPVSSNMIRKPPGLAGSGLCVLIVNTSLFRAKKNARPGPSQVTNGVVTHDVSSSEDKDSLETMVSELQSLLEQRKAVLDNLESEKDILEKENMLKETEVKVGLGRRESRHRK